MRHPHDMNRQAKSTLFYSSSMYVSAHITFIINILYFVAAYDQYFERNGVNLIWISLRFISFHRIARVEHPTLNSLHVLNNSIIGYFLNFVKDEHFKQSWS